MADSRIAVASQLRPDHHLFNLDGFVEAIKAAPVWFRFEGTEQPEALAPAKPCSEPFVRKSGL
jgi:hypothetical protein